MKKLILLLLSMMIVFSACAKDESSKNSADQKKDQTIQLLVPGYDTGYLKKPLDEGIKKFEAANKGIKVEIQSVGWDELNTKVVQLYQAKKAPDIMLVGSRSLRQFSEQGMIEDLTPLMTDDFKKERIDSIMETAQIDGKQYGIPLGISSRALYYRSDLIKTPPKNWDELLQMAQEVHKKDPKVYGFAIPTDLTAGTDELLNFIYQGGGTMVDDKGKLTMDSKENIDTLTFLSKFKGIIPDPISMKRSDQSKMFINGNLAMFISGPWEKEEMDKNKDKTPYEVAMLPKGKKESVTLVTDSYTVSSLSSNKELAYRFIEFMGKADQQRPVSEEYGWYPVTKAEEADKRFKEAFNQPFYNIMKFGHAEPKVSNWDEFDKSFTIAVQKVLSGKANPKEALEQAQKENQQ